MNRAEYQRLRRQLDEELRAGIDLLQAGYRAKVEDLDAKWGEPVLEESPPSEPEVAAPPAPEPAAPAAEPRSKRRREGEVESDIEAALDKVGDVFLKRELCRALGYEPPRTSFYRALAQLERDGIIKLESPGVGRRAGLYRKVQNKRG